MGNFLFKAMFLIFFDFSKMRFVGIPSLSAQIGYALEGVVVFSGDIVHVVALGSSLSDVCSVELVVDGELHSMAVVRKGMAQYARLRLHGLHEGASIGGDDGHAAELRLDVDAAEGFEVYAGRQQASKFAEEESSRVAM